MSAETALVPHEKAPVGFGTRGIELRSLDDAWRMATAIVKSGLAPKGINSPEAALVAIQSGMELGMTCMQSLQNLTVINGKIGITGDAALALVRSSPLVESWREYYDGAGDEYGHVIVSRRRGESESYTSKFTVGQARRAQLWGKPGPWSQYAERMLRYRNLGFHLRDYYPEPLKGFKTSEELADYPSAGTKDVTPIRALEVDAAPRPRKHDVTEEQLAAIAAEAERTGRIPDDIAQELCGMPVMDLTQAQAQRVYGHMRSLPAATEAEAEPKTPAAESLAEEDAALAKRDRRARALAAMGHVARADDGFEVDCPNRDPRVSRVWRDEDGRVRCGCAEFTAADDLRYRCEHILAVKYFLEPPAEEAPAAEEPADDAQPFDEEPPPVTDAMAEERAAKRESEGRMLAASGRVERDEKAKCYYVKSDRQGLRYKVTKPGEHMACSCPDFKYNGDGPGYKCKHIYSVIEFAKGPLPLVLLSEGRQADLLSALTEKGLEPVETLKRYGVDSGRVAECPEAVFDKILADLY